MLNWWLVGLFMVIKFNLLNLLKKKKDSIQETQVKVSRNQQASGSVAPPAMVVDVDSVLTV